MNRLNSDERSLSAPVLEEVVPGPGKVGEKEGRISADHDDHDDYDDHNLSDYLSSTYDAGARHGSKHASIASLTPTVVGAADMPVETSLLATKSAVVGHR